MDLGFHWAGFQTIWANDFLREAADTYTVNLGQAMHHGDIKQMQLPDIKPDVIIGGPPCQSYSQAGRMDPNDPRGEHVFHFIDIVNQYQPQVFVMENVKSLAQNTRFEHVRTRLFEKAKKSGYQVELFLLNASHYQVPQARERMFLIGSRKPLQRVQMPQPVTLNNRPTVRDALSQLPAYGQPGNSQKCKAVITPAKIPVLRSSAYAGMLFNGAGRPLDFDAPSLTLPASMGGNKTPIIDQQAWENGTANWVVGYHRKLQAGKSPIKRIPQRLRRLTVEEASALQTFPIDFEFQGSQSMRFHQIGNAVPPFLAYHVATAVRHTLGA